MTTATAKAEMYARIEAHGRELLRLFPAADVRDPVRLCKLLRRQEVIADRASVMACNGEIGDDHCERVHTRVLEDVAAILGPVGPKVFINSDPRGYALKIAPENLPADSRLHRDWGGYGIIAPDLRD